MDMDGALLVKFASGEWRPSKSQSVNMAKELIKLRSLVDLIQLSIDKAKDKVKPEVVDLNHARYLMKV
jgi:hypothetical protein